MLRDEKEINQYFLGASNTYEEQAIGLYPSDRPLDESEAASYVMTHVRNQLSFDLWYIFFGTFCICVAESGRIKDVGEPVGGPSTQVYFITVHLSANAVAPGLLSLLGIF